MATQGDGTPGVIRVEYDFAALAEAGRRMREVARGFRRAYVREPRYPTHRDVRVVAVGRGVR